MHLHGHHFWVDSKEFGENTRPVLPGMVVQANVVTGSKSLMRYMLKPIVRSLDTAFGER